MQNQKGGYADNNYNARNFKTNNIKSKGAGQMNCSPKNQTAAPEPFVLNRKIGSTLYKVGVHLSPNASETLDDKIRRLLKNELKAMLDSVKMDLLQAGWLSERGAS
jgi:hypothetical protein